MKITPTSIAQSLAAISLIATVGCTPNGKLVQSRTANTTDSGIQLDEAEAKQLTPNSIEVTVEETPALKEPNDWNTSSTRKDTDPTKILGTIAGLYVNPADKDLWSLLGSQAWAIIEKNKPVLNYNENSVSVLPAGYTDWTSMHGWKTRAVTYRLRIKNLYNMTVVDQAYTVKFNYGGKQNSGRGGRYLANVAVIPKISVVTGYKLNSGVEFSRVVNAGTPQNPIPALELKLTWNVKTILKEARETDSFVVDGNGNITHLN